MALGDIQTHTALNIGKGYVFDGIPYILQGTDAIQDAGNNIRVDTHFYTLGEVKEFPSGTWNGQDVAIPKLQLLGAYDVGETTISAKTAADIYDEGGVLPWLV